MKMTVIFAALLMISPLVQGQAAKPAAAPEAKPAAQQQASAKPAAAKSRRTQDARHCLSQPSNTAVIKCAEAYL